MTAHNTLTDAEKSAGFKLLFDGQSTAGWRGYGKPEIYPHWRVVDGTLRFHPDEKPEYGHDIISVESFSSFELRVDWVLYKNGNSGIMYHVREHDHAPFMSGPEIQLLDDAADPNIDKYPQYQTGGCYDLYPPIARPASPIGQWNRQRLIVDGDKVEHHLNDVLTCAYTLGSADWNARIAASKFKEWPHFASERRGGIVLQDHLNPVAFRNIRIRTW